MGTRPGEAGAAGAVGGAEEADAADGVGPAGAEFSEFVDAFRHPNAERLPGSRSRYQSRAQLALQLTIVIMKDYEQTSKEAVPSVPRIRSGK